MAPSGTKRPLTEAEKKRIWEIIRRNMREDDRDPEEVMRDFYEGDEDRYLAAMAQQHRVVFKETGNRGS